jgi:hypothetical protein
LGTNGTISQKKAKEIKENQKRAKIFLTPYKTMNSACETIHFPLSTLHFFLPPIDEIGKCGQISKPLSLSAETKT